MQRDAKLVSYDIVDKKGKPYIQVRAQYCCWVDGGALLMPQGQGGPQGAA